MRQSFPLSQILFTLIIEELTRVIRNNCLIKGIDNREGNKIKLFADDALLINKNPKDTLQKIRTHLNLFEEITGLKVNRKKSECILLKK